MAEVITTCLQQTIRLTTSSVWAVVDSFSSRSVTFGTVSTNTYWRVFIASSASPGTPSTTIGSPKSLMAHVENILRAGGAGSIWSLAWNAAGFITIRYSGTGTATLTFTDTVVSRILGCAAGPLSFAAGETKVMANHPTHNVYMISDAGSTNWQASPPMFAISEMPDGSSYELRDSQSLRTRTFDSRFHPFTWTSRTTLGMAATDSSATPFWGDSSRYKAPSSTAGVVAPWGLNDFFWTCGDNGGLCGALFGTFQQVPATVTIYDVVTIAASTKTALAVGKPSLASWSLRSDWPGITCRQYTADVSF